MSNKFQSNHALNLIFGKVELETIEKRMQGKKLKQTERNYLSRSIRPKLMAARIIGDMGILEDIRRSDKSLEKRIIFSLSHYGYGLITEEKKKYNIIPLEELIVLILTRCPRPRLIESIPILLLKNKIDKFRIAELARSKGIMNKLGYLIETSIMLAKRKGTSLDELLAYLEKNKEHETSFLSGSKDDEYARFILSTTPDRMKRWNLAGRFFDEDFFKLAEVYL